MWFRLSAEPQGTVLEPPTGDPGLKWRDSHMRRDVKSGPFTAAEKDTIRSTVMKWAGQHGESMDDFSWIYNKSVQKTKFWKEVGAALPDRTIKAVWSATTRMYHQGNYQGKWTAVEDAQLLAVVNEHGKAWKKAGAMLGRMPEACRDRWREIRLGSDRKSGSWSSEEVAKLQRAITEFQEARQGEEGAGAGPSLQASPPSGKSGAVCDAEAEVALESRRMVLDDIDWNLISTRVGTRSNIQCLEKWYRQLSPSMVARGEWGTGDDRRLIRGLWQLGATREWEVDWGSLVKGRGATQTRRRWRLMMRVVPDHREMEFWDQVEWLVNTYLPSLKDAQSDQGAA